MPGAGSLFIQGSSGFDTAARLPAQGYAGYIPACEAIPYSVKDETRRLMPAASVQRDIQRPVRLRGRKRCQDTRRSGYCFSLSPGLADAGCCPQRSRASSRLPPIGRFMGTTYDYDFFRTNPELPKERVGR